MGDVLPDTLDVDVDDVVGDTLDDDVLVGVALLEGVALTDPLGVMVVEVEAVALVEVVEEEEAVAEEDAVGEGEAVDDLLTLCVSEGDVVGVTLFLVQELAPALECSLLSHGTTASDPSQA